MIRFRDVLMDHFRGIITLLFAFIYTLLLQVTDVLYILFCYPRVLPYKIVSLGFSLVFLPGLWHLGKQDDPEALTYGSAPLFTAIRVLKKVDPTLGDRFLDLGSGRGIMVFAAALAFGMDSTGVELQAKHLFVANLIKKLCFFRNTHFEKADFFRYEIKPVDIIFVTTTCFPPFMELLLTKKLENLTINTKIITLSSPLISEKIKLESECKAWFSWGRGTVYFQRVCA